jgi:GMP synthase-like glutamine amidotransferase
VIDSPAPEIGWQPMQVLDTPQAASWFGAPGERVVCHWHYEAFELPAGAELLATSAACPHQAFAIGPHLAMQFHVEVDGAKLGQWAEDRGERYLAALGRHASVQSPAQMREGLLLHLPAQQALARRIYGRWIRAASARG